MSNRNHLKTQMERLSGTIADGQIIFKSYEIKRDSALLTLNIKPDSFLCVIIANKTSADTHVTSQLSDGEVPFYMTGVSLPCF